MGVNEQVASPSSPSPRCCTWSCGPCALLPRPHLLHTLHLRLSAVARFAAAPPTRASPFLALRALALLALPFCLAIITLSLIVSARLGASPPSGKQRDATTMRIGFQTKAVLGMLVFSLTPAYCVWNLARKQQDGVLVRPSREFLERSFR